MKTRLLLRTALLPVLLVLLKIPCSVAQTPSITDYNVVWNSQSENAGGSMPCGGGDIGLNVWVEKGDILFYLSRSGTFDENNAMLKLGRVRIKLSGNPFAGSDFKQELRLQEGGVEISAGHTKVTIWVDVFRPVVHVDVQSKQPVKVIAAYESWRYADHLITDTRECRTNSYKRLQPFAIRTYRDDVSFQGNEVVFYHRNRTDITDIFDYTVQREGMDEVKAQLFNPIKHNIFGGVMQGDGMIPGGVDSGQYAAATFHSWSLQSKTPVCSQQITIGLQVAQTALLQGWMDGLHTILKDADNHRTTALRNTRQWWQQFWNRSYIFIESRDTAITAIARNYQLFRYMLGCNAYGKWPTKFNGGLFTFDPQYVNNQFQFSPDFRLWGGGTMTAQNQRLVYYPMLKSGDMDMMKAQFDFYLRLQRTAELRSKVYWQHNGACFTEQIENFGLPDITEYAADRPAGTDAGMEYNAWLEYTWETVFEFCFMMLETARYEGTNITAYIPFIESCLTFYDEHYRLLAKQRGVKTFDEQGHYIFYPTSAAETYKMTYNSTTVIAAMKVILERMLELPQQYLDSTQRAKLTGMQQHIPPIAFGEFEGHKTIAPAVTWARVQNTETPQLYPVFPWGIYGVGKPDLDIALNTWYYDPHAVKNRSHIGWRQYSIFAARLGLTAEAAELTKLKFRDGPHRFPAFWGPGFDWTPDHNWGGAAMTGLQEMLLQVDGTKMYLLPAWPKDWNAVFKLHAPYNTIIEGRVINGKVENLQVTPASRKKDITVLAVTPAV